MVATRREFLQGALGLTVGSKLDPARIWASEPAAAIDPGPAVDYGSGHFGKWIEDEFGLPAFQYTASLHRKRLGHDGFGVGEMCLRGVFD